MREETKRLLKCDLHFFSKDIWVWILVVAGLQLWSYLVYNMVADMALLIVFVSGISLFSTNIKDWQSQIRMYVSAGMSRKGIFQVLLIRNAAVFLAELFIEAVVAFRYYPKVGIELLAATGFFLLFIWGLGELAGVMSYERRMPGKILTITGYILTTIPGTCSFFPERRTDFWETLFEQIPITAAAVLGALSLAVLAGGIFYARKHMGEYMVY